MTTTLERADAVTTTAQPVPRRRVVLVLARAEGWRLVRHPVVLAGLAVSAVIAVLWFRGDAVVLHRASIQLPMLLLPLYAMLLIAAHANTGRTARDATAEVVDPAPATAADRIAGHLAAALAGGLLAAIAMAIGVLVLWATGASWGPIPAQFLVAFAVATLSGVVGTTAGAWTPARPVILLWLAPLGFVLIRSGSAFNADDRVIAPVFETAVAQLSEFGYRPTAAHLTYLVGIAVALAGVALLRHRRDAAVVTATVIGIVAAVGGGVWQTRGPDDAWVKRLIAIVETPQHHRTCETTAGVEVCTFPGYRAWAPEMATVVAGVRRQLPPARRTGLGRVHQRLDLQVAEFAIGRWTGQQGRPLWEYTAMERPERKPADSLHVSVRWGQGGPNDLSALRLGFQAASQALGIPARTVERRRLTREDLDEYRAAGVPAAVGDIFTTSVPCHTPGQSRTVVALWLAGQSSSSAADDLRTAAADATQPNGRTAVAGDGGPRVVGVFFPHDDYIPLIETPVEIPRVTREALGLAVQLLNRPVDEVAPRIRADLDGWADPATGVTDLVAVFGLTPIPTAAEQFTALGAPPDSLTGGQHGIEACTEVVKPD